MRWLTLSACCTIDKLLYGSIMTYCVSWLVTQSRDRCLYLEHLALSFIFWDRSLVFSHFCMKLGQHKGTKVTFESDFWKMLASEEKWKSSMAREYFYFILYLAENYEDFVHEHMPSLCWVEDNLQYCNHNEARNDSFLV